MRTEIRNYALEHPTPRIQVWVSTFLEKAVMQLFRMRVRRIDLGSPAWHRLQERLGRTSSIGIHAKKRNMFYTMTLHECGDGIFVHPMVSFYYPQNISLGKNVFINRGVYFMAPVQIIVGNNVLIGPYAVFNSGSHNYASRSKLIDEQGHKYGPITIEDDVWVGAHACILPGVTLARGSVVAAGAVVTKPVPPFAVVAGVPAKVIATRNEP